MVNLAEHQNGRGPEDNPVPLADVLDGTYNPQIVNGQWEGGDPVIGKFLEFVVAQPLLDANGQPVADPSMNPADYVASTGRKMIELPTFTDFELANATHRTFEFGRSDGTDEKPWTIKTDGSLGYNMDPRRVVAAPDVNGSKDGSSVEIWEISTGGGWSHPIHIHFEEGRILSKDGAPPPEWEARARKDVYRIGNEVDSARNIRIAIRFREFAGSYMEHCHNTQHEDTSMLMRWDIEKPGQTILLPTPMPTWDSVGYADTHALTTFRTGDQPITAPRRGGTGGRGGRSGGR
jgi:FtsP/CotA-like multicopper oxidase with cupredoxin domain